MTTSLTNYLIICSLVEEVHYERKVVSRVPLATTFFNPELMYTPGALDKFLVGLATQPGQKFDNIVTDQVGETLNNLAWLRANTTKKCNRYNKIVNELTKVSGGIITRGSTTYIGK